MSSTRHHLCAPAVAAVAALAVVALSVSAPLAAIAPWSVPIGVLNQTPLEMAQALPGVDVGGTRMPVAIVFNSAPRFRLGLIDPAGAGGAGAMTFVTIDNAGINFALGTIAETTSGRIGGSYVTSTFDLRFWTCLPPCSTVSTFAIDTAATWIDSNSAAAGGDFVVGGLDNTTGFVHLYTSPDGAVWTPLRTLNPAGGFYRNFDGGERIALAVDSTPALRWEKSGEVVEAVAMNCVFAEVAGTFPNVEKRVDCANGPVPIPYAVVQTDVQDPAGQAGSDIENRIFMEDGILFGVVTRRQDGKVYTVRHYPGGAVEVVQVGNSPTGPEFFGFTMSGQYSLTNSRSVMLQSGLGVSLELISDDDPFQPFGSGPGPAGPEGPVALLPAPPGCTGPECIDLFAPMPTTFFDATAGTTVGVGLAKRPIASFEDGFDTADLGRWSASAP